MFLFGTVVSRETLTEAAEASTATQTKSVIPDVDNVFGSLTLGEEFDYCTVPFRKNKSNSRSQFVPTGKLLQRYL